MMKFLLLLLFLLVGCESEVNQVNQYIVAETKKEAIRVSHRGYDENKIAGFVSAINDGYTILEADIRLRNGKSVLLHDNVIADSYENLESLLDIAQANSIVLILEFKEHEAINKTLDLVNTYNVDVIFASFKYKDLIKLSSITNRPLGFITNKDIDFDRLPAIDYIMISQSYIDRCVRHIKCAAWTIKNKEQFDKVKYKVDYIIEDYYKQS